MESKKELILFRFTESAILNYYLKPYHDKGILKKGQLISNPFLHPEKQKTPSFNFYQGKNGWRYHDFATGDHGDCFDLVMKLNSIGFVEALDLIISDLNISVWYD